MKLFKFLNKFTSSFYTRIIGSFLLIIILLVIAITFSIIEDQQVSRTYQVLYKISEAHEISSATKAALLEESLQYNQLVGLNQSQELVKFNQESNKAFDDELQAYRALHFNDDHDSQFLTQIMAADDTHDQIVKQMTEALVQGNQANAQNILTSQYNAQIAVMSDILDSQDKWFDEQKQVKGKEATNQAETVQKILILGGIGITIFAILAAVTITFFLGRSVSRLKRVVFALAAGDLTSRVKRPGRDEIGQVGKAFNKMAERLSQVLGEIENKRKLGLATSLDVNSIASQLSIAAHQQSNQASEQASSLNNVTTTLQELKETASQIAASSSQVASNAESTFVNAINLEQLAFETRQAGQHGQNQLKKSLDSNYEVQNQVTHYDKVLNDLRQHSEQIGTVNRLIKAIADETHLLSLNASIEAAGAGQYGERFKVVANQIKSLADGSLNATREVTEVVNLVRASIEEASNAMLQTASRVAQSVSFSEEVNSSIYELNGTLKAMDEHLKLVVGSMQLVKGEVDQIKLMTHQQESSIEQVRSTMHSLDSATRETASTSHQLSMTAVELESLSGTLTTKLAA